MPNLRRCILGPLDALGGSFIGQRGVYVVGSNGASITLTKAQIQAFYQTTSGSAASRRTQVETWIKQQISQALGASQVGETQITVTFDAATGEITLLEVS